jgi:iron complex transport system permease protein
VAEFRTERIEIKEEYKRFVGRKMLFIFSSLILIFVIAGISATLGSYPITVMEVYSIIWHGIPKILKNADFIISHGVNEFFREHFTTKEVVVWNLRLPRILMGVLAGIGLAVAGVVMQGILRNPLASPYTLGISSSAGFGAALAIIYGAGLTWIGVKYLVIMNAFLFALIPAFVIVALTRFRGASPETMILAGIAMMYIFSGFLHLMYYFTEPDAMKEAYFWMVGSLGRASWENVPLVLFMLFLCFPLLIWKSWDLNVMQAGDESAKSLGINVERTRIFTMMIACLLTASIISFVGCIGFIGLVAPHICRIVIGADNRFLIPASAFFGASFLLGMDTIGRTIIAPVIIPVGVMMDCIGGPFFLFLLMKRRREFW